MKEVYNTSPSHREEKKKSKSMEKKKKPKSKTPNTGNRI